MKDYSEFEDQNYIEDVLENGKGCTETAYNLPFDYFADESKLACIDDVADPENFEDSRIEAYEKEKLRNGMEKWLMQFHEILTYGKFHKTEFLSASKKVLGYCLFNGLIDNKTRTLSEVAHLLDVSEYYVREAIKLIDKRFEKDIRFNVCRLSEKELAELRGADILEICNVLFDYNNKLKVLRRESKKNDFALKIKEFCKDSEIIKEYIEKEKDPKAKEDLKKFYNECLEIKNLVGQAKEEKTFKNYGELLKDYIDGVENKQTKQELEEIYENYLQTSVAKSESREK